MVTLPSLLKIYTEELLEVVWDCPRLLWLAFLPRRLGESGGMQFLALQPDPQLTELPKQLIKKQITPPQKKRERKRERKKKEKIEKTHSGHPMQLHKHKMQFGGLLHFKKPKSMAIHYYEMRNPSTTKH